jgi:peptidoglycan/LPS O-acetylase OafA/YrhL
LSNPPGAHPPYRADIDGLRAVAVLAVVGFHVSPRLVPGGFIGVDLFFVISGFLITGIIVSGLSAGVFSFAEFYSRRIARIFPALIVVLAAVWIIGWTLLLPSEFTQLGKHIVAGAGFASNFVLWSEAGYFDMAAERKPLLHLWSLAVEEQFYLVWPLLVFVAWRRSVKVVALVAVVGTATFAANLATIPVDPAGAFYFPWTRLWELLAGGLLAAFPRLSRNGTAQGRSNLLAAAGAVCIGAALLLIDGGKTFPGWWAVLPVAGAVALIAAGPTAWINRALLGHRWLVVIGLISYPLYLWHWPLLCFARILNNGHADRLIKVGVVAASFVLAGLTYRLVEQPVRAWRTSYQPRRFAVPAVLVLLLVFAGGAGAASMFTGGFGGRYPLIIQELDRYSYANQSSYRDRRCFLAPEQRSGDFGDECIDRPQRDGAPSVLLWGDSHAAQLYHGLRTLQHKLLFTVTQFTASACAPLIGAENPSRPFCREINDFVLQKVADIRPDTVIMAAYWPFHDVDERLDRTILALRARGVKRVVVMGYVPRWNQWLPRVLLEQVRGDSRAGVPYRVKGQLWPPRLAESVLSGKAARTGAVYISAMDILCNEEGCLARVGDNPTRLTAWDDAHLTDTGSEILVAGALPGIFPVPPSARGDGAHRSTIDLGSSMR